MDHITLGGRRGQGMLLAVLLFSFAAGCAHTPASHLSKISKISAITLTPSVSFDRRDVLLDLTATEFTSRMEDRHVYRSSEEAVYAVIPMSGVKDQHTVRWRWIDPAGRVYVETPPTPIGAEGRSYDDILVFHKLNIRGDAAEDRPGLWKAQAILYGAEKDKATARIERTFWIDPAPRFAVGQPVSNPRLTAVSELEEDIPPPSQVAALPKSEETFSPSLPTSVALPAPVSVFFEFGKTALTPYAERILKKNLTAFRAAPGLSVRGYHDATGSLAVNKRLAKRRAETVAEFLITQGVSQVRLLTVRGESQVYFASNATREGRQKNRRVMVEGID